MRVQSTKQIKNSFGESMDYSEFNQSLIESGEPLPLKDAFKDLKTIALFCNDCERFNHIENIDEVEQVKCCYCGSKNLD